MVDSFFFMHRSGIKTSPSISQTLNWVQIFNRVLCFKKLTELLKAFYEDLVFHDSPPTIITFLHLIRKIYKLHDRENSGVIKYEEFILGKKYIHKTYLRSAFLPKGQKGKKKKKGGKGESE